ncbi:DUF6531 domain-containing protein [Pseudomonas sp. KSR10]|uniref:RHS repeat domain-containing protein n=1 Tax=Pseudomonas sp. KSR10 TaxID=2916654 RepID=UPI001EF7E169|nr:DUF6531 domain-containing protein [Pseudomonas sp. KSR10]MCG6538894.1 DUF6531 domain-containing protein [Pseudomonas sp. KSR10]
MLLFAVNWLAVLSSASVSASETFHWRCLYTHCSGKHDSPLNAAHEELKLQNWDMSEVSWTGCSFLSEKKALCYFTRPNQTGGIYAYRFGAGCDGGYQYSVGSGVCESPEESEERRQRGVPPRLACVGNPINIITGNKFQVEIDYAPAVGITGFSRYYNSSSTIWGHSYSTKLVIGSDSVSLIENNGRMVIFSKTGTLYVPEQGEFGLLIQDGSSWSYRSRQGVEKRFDQDGKLTDVLLLSGDTQKITYSSGGITATSRGRETLRLTQDGMSQPLTLSLRNMTVSFKYDAKGRLAEALKLTDGNIQRRSYHYESNDFPRKLTGITDERGVRYATWAYDDKGRAIFSEHSDGIDRVTVAYNSDGTVSVTNVLGKVAKYSFQTIRGARRIVAIKGEPSSNCPSSNSAFTYDDGGLLKTKTDNKGNVTTYDYNERGLEVSRTEAAGTPEARTITTAWHPTLFLPVTVTEPNQITTYTYDAQGRQLSQTLTER